MRAITEASNASRANAERARTECATQAAKIKSLETELAKLSAGAAAQEGKDAKAAANIADLTGRIAGLQNKANVEKATLEAERTACAERTAAAVAAEQETRAANAAAKNATAADLRKQLEAATATLAEAQRGRAENKAKANTDLSERNKRIAAFEGEKAKAEASREALKGLHQARSTAATGVIQPSTKPSSSGTVSGLVKRRAAEIELTGKGYNAGKYAKSHRGEGTVRASEGGGSRRQRKENSSRKTRKHRK